MQMSEDDFEFPIYGSSAREAVLTPQGDGLLFEFDGKTAFHQGFDLLAAVTEQVVRCEFALTKLCAE